MMPILTISLKAITASGISTFIGLNMIMRSKKKKYIFSIWHVEWHHVLNLKGTCIDVNEEIRHVEINPSVMLYENSFLIFYLILFIHKIIEKKQFYSL